MKESMLTTVDNPYDPFTQTEAWRSFDEDHGYYTREYLARIAKTSVEMSDEEYLNEIRRACEEIIKINPLKIYKIVEKEIKIADN